MIYSDNDIIAAVSTPAGYGAISVIRISGKDCKVITDSIFSNSSISSAAPNTIHYTNIIESNNDIIDDVLVSVFKGPNSYTGEDSLEISTHGNPVIVQKVLQRITELGIRLAEPGEFTKRAFLNNKIDLSQAEAVMDVINAQTSVTLSGARNQLNGALSKKVEELKTKIVNVVSLIELELDFAEEELEFIDNSTVIRKIDSIKEEIISLLDTFAFGKILKEGVNVALVGYTNVGKSSLLNYILKENRAIVSSIPGTTRDVIREEVVINGFFYKLYDTAGIRHSEDIIENVGIERSRDTIKNADIILAILDKSNPESFNVINEIKTLAIGKPIIKILNKDDLEGLEPQEVDIKISAVHGTGINHLFQLIEKTIHLNSFYTEKDVVVNNLRHFDCLKRGVESLEKAKSTAQNNFSGELIAIDLRQAMLNLGEIIGEVTSEDILNNIFSKFCIGK